MCKNSLGKQAGSVGQGAPEDRGGGGADTGRAAAAPKYAHIGAGGVRAQGVAVDRSLESGIVVDIAEDGTGMVIIPPRRADPVCATVFSVASCGLLGWVGLTFDPAVTAWEARVQAAGLGTRVFGLLQLAAMLSCWAVLWWGWGHLLATMFGEETITIGAHEVTYTRGAFGITRTRRWATNHISTFRYRPSSRANPWARRVGAEVRLYSIKGDISLAPGIVDLQAKWLAAQLNELLARQRPSQHTRVMDGFD